MKTSLLAILSLLLLANPIFAQNAKIKSIKVKANGTVAYPGNLSEGQQLSSLRWASYSSVACFPATQNQKFTGHHVFYTTTIPKRSEMFIKVIPKDSKQNFSLYAYEVGLSNEQLPPNLSRCITCEADHQWDYKRRGQSQDHTRKVRLNAINNPYKVVIAVVGAEGLNAGDFTLEIKLNGGQETPTFSPDVKVSKIKTSGALTTINGNLNTGTLIPDLSWAARSNVACFPATQNRKFSGKHVLYEVQLPKYSEMQITVVPTDKSKNFSLYAYSVGTTTEAIVPKLSRCVSCEADHKWDYKKKGKTQDHTRSVKLNAINNPYKVYIGVAGAEKLSEGEFELKVEIKGR
ncbi:MAG: hypothetical protein AAFU64_15260 [Bacteroidota bacterium]